MQQSQLTPKIYRTNNSFLEQSLVHRQLYAQVNGKQDCNLTYFDAAILFETESYFI